MYTNVPEHRKNQADEVQRVPRPAKNHPQKSPHEAGFSGNQHDADLGALGEDWCSLARKPDFFERNVQERT
jgi:hypothetical protein